MRQTLRAAFHLAFATLLLISVAAHAQQPTPKPTTGGRPPRTAKVIAGKPPALKLSQIPIPPLPAFHPQIPVRIQLDNGMVIFLQEDHELPLIDGTARIRGGARDIPADKTGMMGIYGDAWRTSGTAKRNGDELDDFLEARAAKVETSGGMDSTYVSFSCLKKDWNDVFEAFTDILLNPQFRDDKIALAKQQEKTAISRRNDEIGGIAAREARKIAYGADNPYARTPEYWTVDAVTKQDLIDFHARTVHPNNIILGIVGDFDAKEMEARLRQVFGALPRGPQMPKTPMQFRAPQRAVYAVDKPDVNQSSVQMVALGIRRDNPDFYAVTVMNQLFGGGFSSRLFTNIRSLQGLAYSVSGGIGAEYDHPGIFRIGLGTKSQTTVKAVQAIYGQIDQLLKDPGSAAEVKKAKDDILNSFVFNFDSKDKVLAEEMSYEFYGYPLDFLDRYRDEIEKVTPADVARVVHKYVDPNKFALLVVGNEKQFGTPLSTLGPVQNIDISIPESPPATNPSAASPVRSNAQGQELIKKVVSALGGKEKLATVKAIDIKASQARQTPQGEITLQTRQLFDYSGDQGRGELETPMGQIVIAYGPSAGFLVAGGKVNPMPPQMLQDSLKDLRRDMVTVAQHAEDPKYQFFVNGTEKIGEMEAEVLQIDADGAQATWDVDPASGRVLRASFHANGQSGPVHREIDFSDYRDAGGLTLPYKRSTRDDGQPVAETTVEEITVNPQIDPALFQKPKE